MMKRRYCTTRPVEAPLSATRGASPVAARGHAGGKDETERILDGLASLVGNTGPVVAEVNDPGGSALAAPVPSTALARYVAPAALIVTEPPSSAPIGGDQISGQRTSRPVLRRTVEASQPSSTRRWHGAALVIVAVAAIGALAPTCGSGRRGASTDPPPALAAERAGLACMGEAPPAAGPPMISIASPGATTPDPPAEAPGLAPLATSPTRARAPASGSGRVSRAALREPAPPSSRTLELSPVAEPPARHQESGAGDIPLTGRVLRDEE